MPKRMLIDAHHPEETRVVVLDGKRLEELDFESADKQQLKGNIYLAKVTRVEPSLQAAFVEYGGNRHGFLAFSEIHPDYYRIPVADREAILADQAKRDTELADFGDEGDEEAPSRPAAKSRAGSRGRGRGRRPRGGAEAKAEAIEAETVTEEVEPSEVADPTDTPPEQVSEAVEVSEPRLFADDGDDSVDPPTDVPEDAEAVAEADADDRGIQEDAQEDDSALPPAMIGGAEVDAEAAPETASAEEPQDDASESRSGGRSRRSYKIQEVIKRRQIMLVQVTKEERGNKGAALTTYLSLAGRYCVLMPNTPRGGGISRKISSPKERKRMRTILDGLDIPEGMAVILRTAGVERTKAEIKRDFDYLLRLWDSIREQTLQSIAPTAIHEEGNLIKRVIRDLYSKDVDEVLVAGDEGYRTAKGFMRMLMPSHARKVQTYKDEAIPLFHRYQVESQIEAMHSPIVQLRSGGYIVINPTEALVAIDVNSGRSTRERNIEETAYRTNLEAADEIARQLRLRDLAGLIVVDFIDMEENRHNTAVERRLKEAMKTDRARIQLGKISGFGLLELSRQRLRPSLLETHFECCPTCGGTGMVRSIGSSSLHMLRAIEEEGIRRRSSEITVQLATRVALYILNNKRDALAQIETRYGFRVWLDPDDSLGLSDIRIERTRARSPDDAEPEAKPEPVAEVSEAAAEPEAEDDEDRGKGRRRRPRRGRKRAGDDAAAAAESTEADDAGVADDGDSADDAEAAGADVQAGDDDDKPKKRRRRGKRGGRRRNGRADQEAGDASTDDGLDDADAAATGEAASEEAASEEAADEAELPVSEPIDETSPAEATRGNGAAPQTVEVDTSEDIHVDTAAGEAIEADIRPVDDPTEPDGAVVDSALPEVEPPARSTSDPDATRVVSEPEDGKPRRGWWQRLLDGSR